MSAKTKTRPVIVGLFIVGAVAILGAGILKELTGKRRGRLFAYTKYLKLLDMGTEPLQS